MTACTILAATAGILDSTRVDLARDALAEIRAISLLLRRVLATEPEELTAELLARGMLRRVGELADAAATALDPVGDPADDIAAVVTAAA